MAKEASLCLLFLSFVIFPCSGALVGFSYRERGDTAASTSAGTISFLQQNKVSPSLIRIFVTDHRILSTLSYSNVSVDFYLNESQVENFITSKPSGHSWLKAHLANVLPHVDIKSIIASCGRECLVQNEIPLLVSALKSIHSVLSKLRIGREVKVSVAFPLSYLEKLNASYENDLRRILSFIKEIKSFVMIEDSIDGELSKGDHFVQSIIKRTTLAASVLSWKDVPVVLTIKSPLVPSSVEVAQFSQRVSKYLEASTQITNRIVALYAEVHTTEDFAQKELKREEEEIFPVSRREILSKFHIRRTLDDTTNPPNIVFPTNPTSAAPVITPPDTPTIITVPSTNPVTISPTNPAAMPVTVPSTTPVPLPPTNPANSPVPVTNPATTPPVTNPVASYPPPSGGVPVINPQPPPANTSAPAISTPPATNPVTSYPPPSGGVPVINPQPPPANTNAPAISGQSWCVAKTGAPEKALQSALDYTCGTGAADCSQIQQSGSCYNPNTLQNHASYAFNSYYQKNPAPTSCDFGGTATLVNTNPSSGSCIYPSSSSSSTPMPSSPTTPPPSIPTAPPTTPTTPAPSVPTAPPTPPTTPTPSIPTAPTTTSSSSPGAGTSGSSYGTPPSVLNSSNPASGTTPVFGSESPPVVNTTSSSNSVGLRPLFGWMVLVISFVTGRLSMRP